MALPTPKNRSPTTVVDAEKTVSVVPWSSVYVTTTRSSRLTWSWVGTNSWPVASTMSEKPAAPPPTPVAFACCHWKAKAPAATAAVVPSGSVMVNGFTVSARPSVGVVSLMVGAPVGASLTLATTVASENTVSSTPLASL